MTRSDCHEFEKPLQDKIARLKQALMDIAYSQPIPTPLKGWEFCRDVAQDVLAEHLEGCPSGDFGPCDCSVPRPSRGAL